MLACTFLDPGKILLCRILEQYLSGVVSKQIMRGLFLGGSGPTKNRLVARNAATRRFFCKNKLGFADCPKELEELFCRSCKNKLRFVAGCKNSLVFADKSQGGVRGKLNRP